MKRIKLDPTYTQERMDEDTEERIMTNAMIAEYDVEEIKKHLPFYYAAQTGDCESLAKFLSSGEFEENLEPHAYSVYLQNSVTPLHIAARNGHIECVQMLIDHGVDVNSKDIYNVTPLHLAAEYGRYQCLKMLLEIGADCTISMHLPFHQRFPPNLVTGYTPLHLAAQYNHIECVKELLLFGADCSARDDMGNTCLHVAAESGLNECVLFLLRNTCCTAFLSLPTYPCSNIPLHFAVEYGMLESVKELVRLGSDVNHLNGNGMSPLHLVCCDKKLRKDVRLDILKILVLEGHNTDMNNALHPAFFDQYEPEAKSFLIAYGANIDVKHKGTGFTFLEHELIFYRDASLVKYITNCMPHLPFLKSLKIYPFTEVSAKKSAVWHSSVLPNNVTFRLIRDDKTMYVEMNSEPYFHRNLMDYFCAIFSTMLHCPLKRHILLQQPFLDILYEHVNKQLKEGKYMSSEDVNFRYESLMPNLSPKEQLLQLQHHLWYQKMAMNPSTLQHHCRYSIRKCMGPSNIRNIIKLPLPKKLQSYLLFEYNE